MTHRVDHLIPPNLVGIRTEQEHFARYHRGEFPEVIQLSKPDFEAVKKDVEDSEFRMMYFSGKDTVRYRYSWIEAR